MMDRRSFLALLAAVPLAGIVPPLKPRQPIPIWSDVRRTLPWNQDVIDYRFSLMRPEWGPTIVTGLVTLTREEQATAPISLLTIKFQNLRASFLSYVAEHLTDTAAGRAQIHALLDPYCDGVLA